MAGKTDKNEAFLHELEALLRQRKEQRPEGSYTSHLFDEGLDKIAQKVGEEAVEVLIASKNSDRQELVCESADLIYHLIVLLIERDIPLEEVIGELEQRSSGKKK